MVSKLYMKMSILIDNVNRPQASFSGLYMMVIGTVCEIKEDLQALPRRRKDIEALNCDDHFVCKVGFTKHLDVRMCQHIDN